MQTHWPDLEPARWIWYPSKRCLANTFVLFRKALDLPEKPVKATGWIAADSRYLLRVNGQRIQWGPAPSDPRWIEADQIDLTEVLQEGSNALAAQVLYYGHGDGTWPIGKPGFLFFLRMEMADGTTQEVVSDSTWLAHLARSWRPGQYKRWYLRSLQEDFDARLHPYGWELPDFQADSDWLPAMILDCPNDKPPLCSDYADYAFDVDGNPKSCELRPRSIPLLREEEIPVKRLADSCFIEWQRPPVEYFECMPPDSYEVDKSTCAESAGNDTWQVRLNENRGAALTFELEEQAVGWPFFSIEAPEGTVVELMVQESHDLEGPALLNTHFHSWTRFTCREGLNRFETFDFESCQWIQLHIHGSGELVTVSNVGIRRRLFPWPRPAQFSCSDESVQRLLDASLNTLHNSAQETCVDGMGRERQQYSGDVGHQLHPLYFAFGESRLPARFLSTYSQGQTKEGYFLDAWPGFDRLARLVERQIDASKWGPLIDHGVGFCFDCYQYYLHTGDTTPLEEPFPRLLRFMNYLKGLQGEDGLLPVEDIGVPTIWLDHDAFQAQRHKQCAFNLYVSAMLANALAPLCRVFGNVEMERFASSFSEEVLSATVRRFWCPEGRVFVNNLPWISEEDSPRMCDRSLATAYLFNQCPGGESEKVLETLRDCPPEMGLSYPANAIWRLWALSKGGQIDVVIGEFREKWANLPSVVLNNSLQEFWNEETDAHSVWSHCAVAPISLLYTDIAGIRPLEPGCTRCEIRPQLGDLGKVELIYQTPRGPIEFRSEGELGDREISLLIPAGCESELVVREGEEINLEPTSADEEEGWKRYRVLPGKEHTVHLRYS